MHYEGCPDVCALSASFALPWIGEAKTSFAFPWGGPDRRTALCTSLGESGWWWFGWWCVPRVTVRCVPHVSQREGSLQLGWGFWDLTSLKRSNRLIKVSTRREGERLPSGWEDKDSNSCPRQLWKLLGFLEQSSSPFAESHHQTVLGFNLFNLDFPSPHFNWRNWCGIVNR